MSGTDGFHIEYSDVEQVFIDLLFIGEQLSVVAGGVVGINGIIEETFQYGAVREGTLTNNDNVPLIQHINNMSSIAGTLAQYVDSAHNTMASIDKKMADTMIDMLMDNYGMDQGTALDTYLKMKSGDVAGAGKNMGASKGGSSQGTNYASKQSPSLEKSVAMYGGTFAAASVAGQTVGRSQKANTAEKKPIFAESKETSKNKVADAILKNQGVSQPPTGSDSQTKTLFEENNHINEKTIDGAGKTPTSGEKEVISKGLEKSKNIYGEHFSSKIKDSMKGVK